MIEFVKCDDKYVGSEGITCATYMVYDEQVHFVLGSIGVNVAIAPILTEGKVINMGIGNALPATVNPDNPYHLYSLQPFRQWVNAFYAQVGKVHPEVKTVAVIGLTPDAGGTESTEEIADAVETQMDIELVHKVATTPGTSDFYPILTPIIAKNPDMIALYAQGVGAQALIIKQARELGFKGILAASNHGEPLPGCAIAGNEAYTGVYHNEPVYDSDLYPEETRELYDEFTRIYPGEPCGLCHYLGFSTIYFYKQAIETAGSIDPDDVIKVFDDPTWTYEWWGQPGRSLGGLETFGIRRVNQDETVLTSTDENCQKVPISRQVVIIP
jgi:branched-chain amino acid transport system substrate-binding protein